MDCLKAIETKSAFRGRDIVMKAAVTESGIAVLIAGGDLAHIGAVSVIGPGQPLQTTVFPGHKEAAITEEWAGRLFNKAHVPVVVSGGIHYNDITHEEISEVLRISRRMLEELIQNLLR